MTYKLDQEINFKIKCCNAVWARATEETTWKRGQEINFKIKR